MIGVGVVVAAVVSLLPAWPYKSFTVHTNASERAKSLSIIPAGSVVVTYPYPTTFYDSPMLWQALDSMRFRLASAEYAPRSSPDKRRSVIGLPRASAVGPQDLSNRC